MIFSFFLCVQDKHEAIFHTRHVCIFQTSGNGASPKPQREGGFSLMLFATGYIGGEKPKPPYSPKKKDFF